jgi:NodT family efflux transporter outer membrane factor (OMF) lipoprotein
MILLKRLMEYCTVPRFPKLSDSIPAKKIYLNILRCSLILSLTACEATRWIYSPPVAAVPDRFKTGAQMSDQKFVLGQHPEADWWKGFGNPSLDKIVDEALIHHPTIASAQAAITQAQSDLEASRDKNLIPQVALNTSFSRQHTNSANVGGTFPFGGSFNLFNAAINVSYSPDLFGSIHDALAGLDAQVDVERFALEAARLNLAGNVVTTVAREAGLRAQKSAVLKVMEVQQAQIHLVQSRMNIGSATRNELLSAQGALELTQSSLPSIEKSLAQTRNLLATLVAQGTQAESLPIFELSGFKLPPTLPISLPSELARQRPDILAAEASVRAANAAVGVADGNLYPSLSLTGSYGGASNRLSDLLKNSSNLWSFGAGLVTPLIDRDALRAKKKSAEAAYEQVRAQYRDTVLQALQSVSDALAAIEQDNKTFEAQRIIIANAQASQDLAEAQLKLGSGTQQQLLGARLATLQAEVNLGQQQANRLINTVSLYQSLGGGWTSQVLAGGAHPVLQTSSSPSSRIEAKP